MQIQRINRNDPESIKIMVKNVDGGGSITTGMGVCLVAAGASNDGVSAVKSTAALWEGFIGVAAEDIPINGYGRVTCFGTANSVLFSHVGSSITVTGGDILIPGAVAGTFFSTVTDQAVSTLFYRYVLAASSPTISTQAQAYGRGIVRAM